MISISYKIVPVVYANILVSARFESVAHTQQTGDGAASKGNRIPGIIYYLVTPVDKLGVSAIKSQIYELGVSILRGYNKSMAVMLDSIKGLKLSERASKRREGILAIQIKLLKKLSVYCEEELRELAKFLPIRFTSHLDQYRQHTLDKR